MFDRSKYLNQLIKYKDNDYVKIITGLRRSGKSWLLDKIYRKYLQNIGIDNDHIIYLRLDLTENAYYRDPIYLDQHMRSFIKDDKPYYMFIDEIQQCYKIENPALNDGKHILAKDNDPNAITFVGTALGLQNIPNVDLYVTGSNSKMLSSDIKTEFRDKGQEIRIEPFSFLECKNLLLRENNFDEYMTYGGMPHMLELDSYEDKEKYLKDLYQTTYIKDIIDRNKFKDEEAVKHVGMILASCNGQLINANTISNTFKSITKKNIFPNTIREYINAFIDSFLIEEVRRYDIRGRKHIGAVYKYYFKDIGLRNAMLNFLEIDKGQIMENIIYNELIHRGFSVDIGIIESQKETPKSKSTRIQYEVDFIAIKGNNKIYIQSAYNIDSTKKEQQEKNSLIHINDSFKKLIIVKDDIIPKRDDKGIITISLKDFLENESYLS